jgi:para-aminobenzoate synthetase/4-amino-4-deoxychorismate lyase
MERIISSAQYYSIPFRADDAMDISGKAVNKSVPENLRIKLILNSHGKLSLESSPISPLPYPYIVSIAASPVDRDNPFLKHKTSVRYMYSNALSGAGNCSDVILYNREMELTESTIANIVLKIDGGLYTPPVSSGLLPGTMRHTLIISGKIKEKVLYLNDLEKAEDIYLINSLRGWINPLLK